MEATQKSTGSAKHECDIAGKVKRHPWLFVFAALLIGYFWGWLRRSKHAAADQSAEPDAMQTVETVAAPNANQADGSTVEAFAATAEKPAAADQRDAATGDLHGKLRELKSVAIGAGVGALREMVVKRVVPDMQAYIVEVMNTLTTRLGGEVIPGPSAGEKPATGGAASKTTSSNNDAAGGKPQSADGAAQPGGGAS